jgi:hypothetical protein
MAVAAAGEIRQRRIRHAAAARFWAASYLAEGHNLYDLIEWTPISVARFASGAKAKITALRKKREYDSSDGLAVWLHTARAVSEPRIAPPVREIWHQIMHAGPNADSMAHDLLQDSGLPIDQSRRAPKGFYSESENLDLG